MSAKSGAHAELFISICVMRKRFLRDKTKKGSESLFAADQLSGALGISRYIYLSMMRG